MRIYGDHFAMICCKCQAYFISKGTTEPLAIEEAHAKGWLIEPATTCLHCQGLLKKEGEVSKVYKRENL